MMTKMQGTTLYGEVILSERALPEPLASVEPMQNSFVVEGGSVGPFIIVSIGLFVMDLSGILSLCHFLSLSSLLDA